MSLPPRWRWKLDRWRERAGGMLRGEPREERPRLCPSCGTLVGAKAGRCHECGTSLAFSLAAASRSLSSLLPATSPVTYVVLGVNGFLFLVSLLATMQSSESFSLMGGIQPTVLLRLGARQAYLIFQGELWRLVMPIFLHGSLMHIGMNSIILMDLGPQLEELYGSSRFLFLYVATGIASFVVSTWWSIYTQGGFGISIGASGALMGLIGLLIAVTRQRGGAAMEMIRTQLVRWVVYIFVIGFLLRGTDNAAHFGGLVAGYLLGKVTNDREPMNSTERQRAYALGWSAALVVVASFAAMLWGYFRSE